MDDIKIFNYNDSKTHLLFDSAGRNENYYSQQHSEANKQAGKYLDELATTLNSVPSTNKKSSLGYWSLLRGASEYNIFGQRSLEAMTTLRKNEDILVYDIESLGTPKKMRKQGSADFFSPTEIAFQKAKFKNGKLELAEGRNKALSLLLKPDAETHKALQNAIDHLSTNGWRGMSSDLRRSLADLTAYAGEPGELFKTKKINNKSYTHIDAHAPKVSNLGSLAHNDVIKRMQTGLNNLATHGTKIEDAMEIMNDFVPNKRGKQKPVRFAGYNTYNYDEPALKEFFDKYKPDVSDKTKKAIERLESGIMSKDNIDAFHALKTVTEDPYSKFGSNMTLSNVHEVFGFEKRGQAHHALTDIKMTADVIGKTNEKVTNAMEKVKTRSKALDKLEEGKGVIDGFFFDKTPMKAGQELYSFSGINSYAAGDYDGVLKKEGEKLSKEYDLKQNPVYARTVYKIDNFFEDLKLGDKKMYGVQLSTDEGQVHTLFRESKEELGRVMQNHFLPVSKNGVDRKAALDLQNEDRAVRRYNRMFEMGTSTSEQAKTGANLMLQMYENIDEIKGMTWGQGVEKLKEKYGGQNWFTDSYVRDLETMRPRLEAEEKLWKPFLHEVEGLGTNKEKTIALRHFRDQVQEDIGTNKLFMQSGGEAYMPITVDGKTSQLRGLDRNAMVRTIRSTVEGNGLHTSRPNAQTIIGRFNELVDQNLMPAMSSRSMKQKMKEIQKSFHQQIMANNSVNTIYEEMATMVGKVMEINHKSLDGYERERVSAVSAQYTANLNSYNPDKNKMRKSIIHASHHGRTFEELTAGPLQEFFQKQQQSVKGLVKNSGLDPSKLFMTNHNSFDNMTDVEGKVRKLVNAYTDQGFRVQMFYDKDKGMSMGIMDGKAPESLARQGYQGLRQSNNAAVVHLPFYGEGGKIRWRNQEHLNRFVSNVDKNGRLNINTVFDDAMNRLINSASRFKESYDEKKALGEKDFFIRMQSSSEKAVQKVLERSPMDYNLGFTTKDDKFEVRSNRANYNRSMTIDTHKLAEPWYREQYQAMSPAQRTEQGFLRNADEIAEEAKRRGSSFFESMHFNSRAKFNSQVDQWARNRYNLDTSAHGVNDRHMAKGYRSLSGGDPRMQSAFGAFDATSGENRLKALNYYGLDKTNVEKTLARNGESEAMIRRRTNYGTVTSLGEEVKGNELDGISMRTAYMSDEQVAQSLANNKDALMKEIDKMQTKGEISPGDANKYKTMIKNGQLSTYEGMSLLSKEFQSAFDITRNVRERLRDGYELDGNLKKALSDHADKLGVQFDDAKSVNFEDLGRPMSISETRQLFNQDGTLTIGKMATDETKTSGYTGSNKEVFIKGWDAENKMLLLGQVSRGDDAMKTVTNTGRRHTETFLPQKIIGMIAGQDDVEAIVPEFGASKRMGGAYLEEKVRVYEDEIIRQLHSKEPKSPEIQGFLKKHNVTVGSMTTAEQVEMESKALNEILMPKVRENLNLSENDIWATNGKVYVNERLGFDNHQAGLSPNGIKNLDNVLSKDLGYDFNKNGVDISQVIKQRHDVWADQFVVGADSKEGRVRVGLKELDAIEQHVGKDYAGFLRDQVSVRSSGGNATRGVAQSMLNYLAGPKKPQQGDVVFDMSAMRPEIEKVGNVELNGRVGANGAVYVNPDSVTAMGDIKITAKDTKIFSDEYTNTLLNSNRLKLNYDDNGVIREGKVSDVITEEGKAKGTAYLKLPDNSFNREYMPLVDFYKEGANLDDQYLNEIQKTQRNIVENVERYNKLGSTGNATPEQLEKMKSQIQQRVNTGLEKYEQQMNSFLTNGQDSGFINKTANARLDMSGHFRAQGTNPFAAYEKVNGTWENTGAIKENVAYTNPKDFKKMIAGAEDNIIDIWNKEAKKADSNFQAPEFKTLKEKQEHILQNVNEKGIYGTTIRYPIIDASTAQTMKYEVADWVGEKSMHVGIGSTSRIAGDYDGDVFAGILTSYKSKAADVHHRALSEAYEKERVSSVAEGRSIMADLENGIAKNLRQAGQSEEQVGHVISNLNQAGALSAGDLARAGFDEQTTDQIMQAKTRIWDNVETSIARTGKEYIGHIDNARQRISTLHGITQGVLQNAGVVTAEQSAESMALVNEVTRRLSQDSISAKKFTVGTLMKDMDTSTMTQQEQQKEALRLANMRNEKLAYLREQLYNPNMDIDSTIKSLDEIGVIKPQDAEVEVGIGRNRTVSYSNDEDMFRQGLQEIRQTNRLNQHVGGYNAAALKIGGSQGTNIQRMVESGDGFIPTKAVNELREASNDEVRQRFDSYSENYKSGVVRLHQQNQDAEKVFSDMDSPRATLASEREILAGDFTEKRASTRFKDTIGKMIPDKIMGSGGIGTGAAAGAMAFGAMWATSALMKKAPTPEGLQEQQQGPAVSADRMLTQPTARVTQNNGEYINLQISAKDARSMNHADITNIVNNELQAMTNVQMDMNLNVNDNSQNIDQKWLQDLVTNAVGKGYAFGTN